MPETSDNSSGKIAKIHQLRKKKSNMLMVKNTWITDSISSNRLERKFKQVWTFKLSKEETTCSNPTASKVKHIFKVYY